MAPPRTSPLDDGNACVILLSDLLKEPFDPTLPLCSGSCTMASHLPHSQPPSAPQGAPGGVPTRRAHGLSYSSIYLMPGAPCPAMRVAAVLRLAQDAHVLQGRRVWHSGAHQPRLRGRIAVCGPVGLGPAQRRLEARRSSRARGSGIPRSTRRIVQGSPASLAPAVPLRRSIAGGARPVIMAR